MKLDLRQAIKQLCASAAVVKAAEGVAASNDLKESAIRDYATSIGFYAESGPTFDPKGKYLCGTCCFRLGEKACDLVSGKISMTTGSCMMWRIGEPVGLKVKQKLTQIEAQYAERPKAKGFGCSRCEYGQKAEKPDAQGRESWCTFWQMHIKPPACCFREDGPDLVEPKK